MGLQYISTMTARKLPWLIAIMLLISGMLAAPAAQARVKLVALPDRADTFVRMDNPTATLIEEERVLTLQQGLNHIDFSWKGVSIDPDSIRLTPLTHPGEVVLLNVSYPPEEAALVWEINSKGAWEEKVRITYLLSYIDRIIAYKLVAAQDETKADFRNFLVLRNFSGEDFEKANFLMDYGEGVVGGLLHEETKQLLYLQKDQLPVTKVWTFDSALLPWDPEEVQGNVGIPVTYHIKNAKENSLGEYTLWGGKVRVFQNDGHGGTIILGEDNIDLVPVGEEMKVQIGDSRDLVVTQRKMSEKKINVRRNKDSDVIMYDSEEVITAKAENFKDQPAVLTIIQHIPGQWDMKDCNLPYERKDLETLEFQVKLPARGQQELTMHYYRRNIRP
jgi:hypothetical protein